MKRIASKVAMAALAAASFSFAYATAPAVQAEEAGHGKHAMHAMGVKVTNAWTRVTPPGAKVAGGFLTVTNHGKEADRLIGGSFPLSKRLEVHEMSVTDGVMRMQEVEGGIEIAPGATVELKPGGYHLMFMGLTASPELGKPVKGTVKFKNAGDVAVEFSVAPIGAKSSDGKGGKMGGDMKHGGHHMKH